MEKQYHIIGACSCFGAKLRACERGAKDLVDGHVFDLLKEKKIPIRSIEMLYPSILASEQNIPMSESLPLIHAFNWQLAEAVKRTLRRGDFPIVLGGDHANAVGTWNGVGAPLGLLWIDAHMDAHTPETTPSGAFHGMPVAALLGHGTKEMAQLLGKEPVLKPENIALIGVRSFEEGEAALLKQLGVRIYFMDEVKKRGLQTIIPEAIAHVMRTVNRLGVSIDLDSLDPTDAPGVGSPEAGGIHTQELLDVLHFFREDTRFKAFELVEFNPERDIQHKTRKVAFKILYEIMR